MPHFSIAMHRDLHAGRFESLGGGFEFLIHGVAAQLRNRVAEFPNGLPGYGGNFRCLLFIMRVGGKPFDDLGFERHHGQRLA